MPFESWQSSLQNFCPSGETQLQAGCSHFDAVFIRISSLKQQAHTSLLHALQDWHERRKESGPFYSSKRLRMTSVRIAFDQCDRAEGVSRQRARDAGWRFLPHGPMLDGVQGLYPRDEAVTGAGGLGGAAQGVLLKSKNSSRSGCAASRAVRCAALPMNRFSTNLMMAV